MPAPIRKLIVKSFGVIVNPVICLHPGNRPITDRSGGKTDRSRILPESSDNLPMRDRNLPIDGRPKISRPIRGIVRSTRIVYGVANCYVDWLLNHPESAA